MRLTRALGAPRPRCICVIRVQMRLNSGDSLKVPKVHVILSLVAATRWTLSDTNPCILHNLQVFFSNLKIELRLLNNAESLLDKELGKLLDIGGEVY